ncbi:Fic family protein [Brevundimonas sp.]|uniref:Fic family protein n=1 Tax=Brevundimonas sp. TaxID=1871086 RepID=UPI002D50A288|nr:Fic family protein [Brevundimonas sp.]HYC96845.1 Fic family protein [Brevundimonas sp.]
MPRSPMQTFPEVFVSTSETATAVSRAVRQGELRQIGSKLYTRNLVDPPEQIVGRHLWTLVGAYIPGALIADRTAIENKPAADGSVFVVSDRKRDIELPGVTIRTRRGAPPQPTDLPFVGNLFLSSTARAYLDNMAPSRRRGGDVTRTLTRGEIEAHLDTLVRRGGEAAANRLRDEARRIAPMIGREAECETLERLIGALLGTRDEPLITDRAQARRAGVPFDPERLARFELLHRELRATAPVIRPAAGRTPDGRSSLAFFEAYFSNFIEGTEFEVSEAADIVFRNVIPRDRPSDAHDVLGTWRLVSDPVEMARTPRDAPEFFDLLKGRHAALMAARPDKNPGAFKQEANRAGQTTFVDPAHVEGTLARGLELYHSLETPFARAVYMMFLVSEVHPFADGNGRIGRIMMNAELVAADEERIIIPTIFRSNYLTGLKVLSNSDNPNTLIRSLDFAQKWVAAVPWADLGATQAVLEGCNAFMDPAEADERGIRLRLPQTF